MQTILEGEIAAVVVVFVLILFVSVVYTIARVARGDVWIPHHHCSPFAHHPHGYWIRKPRGSAASFSEKRQARLTRRKRTKLPRNAKYLCFSCEGEIRAGYDFCPHCGEKQGDNTPEIAFPVGKRRRGAVRAKVGKGRVPMARRNKRLPPSDHPGNKG